ncbi:MAG: DUF2846 domain-containing protein [Syntrophobacteraceae bacterium]
MANRLFFTLMVFSLLLVGCAGAPSKGQHFQSLAENREGYSLLYIFRPHQSVGRIVGLDVLLNGTKVVTLPDSSYTYVYAKPGRYVVSGNAPWPSGLGKFLKPIEIVIEPGTVHFLLLDRKTRDKVWGPRPPANTAPPIFESEDFAIYRERWITVSREVALPEIRNCRIVRAYLQTLTP